MPLPEASGQLPVTRYKVRVEHAGAAAGSSGKQLIVATPGTSNSADTTNDTNAAEGNVDTRGEVTDINTDTNANTDANANVDNSGFVASPAQIARMVLVPARETPRPAALQSTAKDVVAEGGQRQRTLVTVRGLKPATAYRVQVGRVCLWVLFRKRATRRCQRRRWNERPPQSYR